MSNHNITKRGTQVTGLGVMIAKCSIDSQHGGSDRHPADVGSYLSRYMNDDIWNHNYQTPKFKTWARENNQLALHCYFRSNPSPRGYRKRMIEIRQKCASFQITSQSLGDYVSRIIRKGWFSDLEMLEIYQKTQKQDNTIPDTSNGANQKQHTRYELSTFENENATPPNNSQSSVTLKKHDHKNKRQI